VVLFHYGAKQMVAKIVYYGPGLCGKTTNLKMIYDRTTANSRGEMVSLETETDRTLFFDLLPIDVGVIGGFKTKFQLYTVPGQVFYNVTRKLVLKNVDGIVFVADSQKAMLDANKDSFLNLQENLRELAIPFEEIPLVLQYNKRDLKNISTTEELHRVLNPKGRFSVIESSALQGIGVFETLKEISRLTLEKLKVKVIDQQSGKPSIAVPPPTPAPRPAPPLEDDYSEIDDALDETFSVNTEAEAMLPDAVDDTLPDGESSLPGFFLKDEDLDEPVAPVYPPGESSLPTINLDDVDFDDAIDFDEDLPQSDARQGSLDDVDEEEEISLDFDLFDDQAAPVPDPAPPEEMDVASVQDAMAETLDEVTDETSGGEEDEEVVIPLDLMEDPSELEPFIDSPPPPLPEITKKAQPQPHAKEDKPALSSTKSTGSTASRSKTLSPLDELNSLNLAIHQKTGKKKAASELDDLLSQVAGNKPKTHKTVLTTDKPFRTLQINFVLLDDHDRVMKTQLIKIPGETSFEPGSDIRLQIKIEKNES
jgi:hypothetical protein